MKRNSTPFRLVGLSLATLILSSASAQNTSPFWSLAGNSNANSISKLGTTTADPVNLTTNDATRIFIAPDGKVGIGTSTPAQQFHVEGQTLLNLFVSTSALSNISGSGQIGYTKFTPTAAGQRLGYFLFGSRGGAENNYHGGGMVGYADGAWSSTSWPTNIAFETAPSGSSTRQERMRITSGGNVGIGTTAPTFNLDVRGTGSTGGQFKSSSSEAFVVIDKGATTANNYVIYRRGGLNRWTVGTVGNDNFSIRNFGGVGGDAVTIVHSNSFVGLGTTTPGQRLEVAGNVQITGEGTEILFSNGQHIGDGAASLGIDVHGDLLPDNDGNHHLGSDAQTWIDVWATDATINTSDARFKKNIENSPYGLKEIMKLRPVTYQWLKGVDDGKRIGLIAQEVQPIIPEMVKDSRIITDHTTGKTTKVPTTRLGLQYDALIPVLIKGMQQQQDQIEQQQQQIEELKQLVNTLANGRNIDGAGISGATLKVTPNPAKSNTVIRYSLPEDANRGQLLITDASGRTVKVVQLAKSGSVNVDVSALSSGVYNYSLVVDGKTVQTKRLTIEK